MGGRAEEGTGMRVRRIIKTASEECASAYPCDATERSSTSEKLAMVSVVISMPAEIVDNRTSITIQGIEEPRLSPLIAHTYGVFRVSRFHF